MDVVWHKSTALQYYVHAIIWNVQYIHKNIILTRVPCPLIKGEDIVRTMYITNTKALNRRIKSLRDNIMSYNSEQDEWKFPVVATRDVIIPKGTRIAQFRVQLSQKATRWQKLKWLLSGPLKLVRVDHLDNESRGGFGEGTADPKKD